MPNCETGHQESVKWPMIVSHNTTLRQRTLHITKLETYDGFEWYVDDDFKDPYAQMVIYFQLISIDPSDCHIKIKTTNTGESGDGAMFTTIGQKLPITNPIPRNAAGAMYLYAKVDDSCLLKGKVEVEGGICYLHLQKNSTTSFPTEY